jgi:hypothetical protein
MPLFYLHLRCEGEFIRDDEGCEYCDLAAAKEEAVRSARSIMSAEVLQGRLCRDQEILIHDADDVHLATVLFADTVEVEPLGVGSVQASGSAPA